MQNDHSDHRSSSIKYPLRFLINDIDDPLNVGSLFRIADALGVERLYLCGSTPAPPNRKIRKTSRSTEQYVEYTYGDAAQFIDELKRVGCLFICLEKTSHSIDLKTLKLPMSSKVCLAMGSESLGVSKDILNKADQVIHIPMLGNNSSMNLASATGIAAYTIAQQLTALV